MDLDKEELKATKNLKEKTADEMFEYLGYRKVEDNERKIEYRNIDNEEIDFWFDDNTVSKDLYSDYCYITMQELQAINKKCKELGWIDEN